MKGLLSELEPESKRKGLTRFESVLIAVITAQIILSHKLSLTCAPQMLMIVGWFQGLWHVNRA